MLKDEDYKVFENLLKKESGLVITIDKTYLLESRLMPVTKKWGMVNLSELADKIRLMPEQDLLKDVIEAMTTNETSFFRDSTPFDHFKNVILPYFLKKKARERKLRIWSAACSSGQEPYSLAMILKEQSAKISGWDIEIIATDLSEEILDQAKSGVYSQFEVQRGLPIQLLVQFFEQKEEKWHIKPVIKDMITFKKFNLLGSYAGLGKFDMVFCRNVLIYFDVPTKGQVIEAIKGVSAQDAPLILGGAETVLGITDAYQPVEHHRGLYLRNDTTFEVPEK